jgi:hypothetical protein
VPLRQKNASFFSPLKVILFTWLAEKAYIIHNQMSRSLRLALSQDIKKE